MGNCFEQPRGPPPEEPTPPHPQGPYVLESWGDHWKHIDGDGWELTANPNDPTILSVPANVR